MASFAPFYVHLTFVLIVAWAASVLSAPQACYTTGFRKDCGYLGIDQQQCLERNCCWHEFPDHSPWCFFPNSPPASYLVKSVDKTDNGIKVILTTNGSGGGGQYGGDISPVAMDVFFETETRLNVKIYDPNNQRWEVPRNFSNYPNAPSKSPSDMKYVFKVAEEGKQFSFQISRADGGEVLFNTDPSGQGFTGLTFADQYLALGTRLPSSPNLYGLGEHVHPLHLKTGTTFTMWNFDTATPPNLNLYGSHPFYMDMRDGKAHGVFLRNSNGMDVAVQPGYLTYQVIGGILDFYFFLGPQPEAVIQQYQEVIGRPHMPPYWALGFHQCRYGYHDVETLEEVVGNYSENKIPLDTMWTDIDYMDKYKDFSLDPINFPESKMNAFVSKLHENGQHYVVIIDPGIHANDDGYPAWDDGKKMDVFVKDKDNNIFVGKVWPGETAFPDFFHPDGNAYWKQEISKFLTLLPVDGLWIDMNEISNFCNGACGSFKRKRRSVSGFDPTNPPYAINNQGNRVALNVKTLDMDAKHYGDVPEYNAHNLFGLTEAIATNKALQELKGKRSLVISRSTFPGSGVHTGHWTGDNHANWDDLYYSIPGMLNFQMFGIPLVGSDICGFIGTTNEELCARWMELGAFYPFSRNHDDIHSPPQEPYRWESVADASRKALATRYSLLPYYYTLFYLAHLEVSADLSPAATVTRPLFFEFPEDSNTYTIDKQFLVGSGLLVSPVLTQGATSVTAYFPKARWFDFYNGQEVSSTGQTQDLSTPLDHIQVHVRGGLTIPMQEPALTTAATRRNPYSLLVALDDSGASSGMIYLDDGETLTMDKYAVIFFATSQSGGKTTLKSTVDDKGFLTISTPPLNTVNVYGVASSPTKAQLNGKDLTTFTYNSNTHSLTFTKLSSHLSSSFTLEWE